MNVLHIFLCWNFSIACYPISEIYGLKGMWNSVARFFFPLLSRGWSSEIHTGNFSASRNLNSQLFQHTYKKTGPAIVISVRSEVVLEWRRNDGKILGFGVQILTPVFLDLGYLTCKVALRVIKVN